VFYPLPPRSVDRRGGEIPFANSFLKCKDLITGFRRFQSRSTELFFDSQHRFCSLIWIGSPLRAGVELTFYIGKNVCHRLLVSGIDVGDDGCLFFPIWVFRDCRVVSTLQVFEVNLSLRRLSCSWRRCQVGTGKIPSHSDRVTPNDHRGMR
jgi:hypothetical protein